jgi:hypothetical protein
VTPPAAVAAPAVHPRRPLPPRGPRRVSGPARPSVPARPTRSRRAGGDAGFALGLISALESLAQHRLLDRLIRGRTWIGIVAFALIGIVTLQLGLLKLNGGIGRALEHEAVLQRQNAALSIENSELASGTRVETRAAHLGMAFAAAGAQHFLSSASQGDIAKAATVLSTTPTASTSTASAAGGESAAQGAKPGESQTGTETPQSSEAATAPASGSESSGSSESSGEARAAGSEGSESASGEARSSAEASAPASSNAAAEPESASSSAPETGAGGGVQATSPGG